MSYLIISTIVILVAAVAVVNGIGLRRQGKTDEGTAWILASALAIIVVDRRLGRLPLLPLGERRSRARRAPVRRDRRPAR